MERTKKPGQKASPGVYTADDLATYGSALVGRSLLAARLGTQSYEGARNLYQALGYPTVLVFDDFLARYIRQDIAKAVIDRPVVSTWQGDLELVESEEASDTPFEKAWKDLNRDFGLKSVFTRVDRLTGIGQYGILLLGLDDIKQPEDFARPVSAGVRKLIYVKPFSQRTARILTFVTDSKSPRFGLPLMYSIDTPLMFDVGYVSQTTTATSVFINVHYSRIIHITDNSLESEVFGTPRLEPVFNRLMDCEKIVGGDSEMFWRGARPGYSGTVDKDYTMTQDTKDALINQLDEYEHNLRRFLVNEGIDMKAMAQQIAPDPQNHLDIQITMISAVTGIPKRILSGSERGQLASTQDENSWKTFVQARREDHAEPRIIRPFVVRMMDLKILPKPANENYKIDWLDLFSISEKERVEIGKSRSNALREYTTNPMAQSVIPVDAFLEYFLGMDTGQIQLVTKMRSEGISEEQKSLMQDIKDISEPTAIVETVTPAGQPTEAQVAADRLKNKPVPKSNPKPAPAK
jgi:hypothetical protein